MTPSEKTVSALMKVKTSWECWLMMRMMMMWSIFVRLCAVQRRPAVAEGKIQTKPAAVAAASYSHQSKLWPPANCVFAYFCNTSHFVFLTFCQFCISAAPTEQAWSAWLLKITSVPFNTLALNIEQHFKRRGNLRYVRGPPSPPSYECFSCTLWSSDMTKTVSEWLNIIRGGCQKLH